MKNFTSKKAAAIILAVVLTLSMFAGCRKLGEDMSSGSTSDISSTVYGLVDIVDNQSAPESVVETTSQTESDNTAVESNDNSSSTSTESTVNVEDPTITVNPEGNEIYGAGSATEPYTEIPDAETQTVTTVSIPAGKSVFYSIRGASGRILTIENANAYVIYDETRHDAKEGRVSFKVESDLLASDYILFEIGNTGSAAASFKITFADEQGSQMNPEVIKSVASKMTLNLQKGDKVGYYYKYVAENSGTLHFYLTATQKSEIRITNNSSAGTIQVFSGDEDLTDNQDDSIYELKIDVTKGDEIVIHMGIEKQGRNYPATQIDWYGEYK